jgi:DNA polymerase-3 subunit beta
MKIKTQRETILRPLQQVIGAVERRQTLPALANVLIRAEGERVSLTTTDLEIELVAKLAIPVEAGGEITVPARKLMDICRALPEGAELALQNDGERAIVRSGRSRFTLATLPASEFPTVDDISVSRELSLSQAALKSLIERTSFAMANQDVRYYLNGLMLELGADGLKAVATDGHRLSLAQMDVWDQGDHTQQVIVPRKGVQELGRLLEATDEQAKVAVGTSHVRVELPDLRFTSKLIDGRFPDYGRVVPKGGDKTLSVERETLRQALVRASILSNEKYRGIRLMMAEGLLRIQAHNPEQEEAEEELEVVFPAAEMEIGFNVNYLLDVLGTIQGDQVELTFRDGNSSALIRDPEDSQTLYVVMPMRL